MPRLLQCSFDLILNYHAATVQCRAELVQRYLWEGGRARSVDKVRIVTGPVFSGAVPALVVFVLDVVNVISDALTAESSCCDSVFVAQESSM